MADITDAKFYAANELSSTTILEQNFSGTYDGKELPSTLTDNTVVSGLTITGASTTVSGITLGIEKETVFNGNTVSNTSGGAIFANTSGTKIVIDGSTFSENRTAEADDRGADGAMGKVDTVNANAGGAIFIEASNSALNIDNTLFYGNTVNKGTDSRNGYGGAIGASHTNINITGSTFTNNRAYGGGAIYVRSNTNTISGSLFYQNYAQNGSLALYSGSDNTISKNTFSSNASNGSGGAIYISCNIAEFTGNTICNNTAASGAGIYVNACSQLTINSNMFDSNSVTASGGGAFSLKSGKRNATFSGNTFLNNKTSGNGGAILIADGSTGVISINGDLFYNNTCGTGKFGGAIYNGGATFNINGATFGTDKDTFYNADGTVNFAGDIIVRADIKNVDGTLTSKGANFVFDGSAAIDLSTITVKSASSMQFANLGTVNFTAQDLSNVTVTVDGSQFLNKGSYTLATGISDIGAYSVSGDLYGQNLSFADGKLTLTCEVDYINRAIVNFDGKNYITHDGKYYTGKKYASLSEVLKSKEEEIIVKGEVITNRHVINTSVDVILADLKVHGNVCEDNNGGAFYITKSPVVAISGGTFSNNATRKQGSGALFAGGAIYTISKNITIEKTLFQSNEALSGTTDAYGGAIATYTGADLTVTGATFTDNTAYTAGGAAYVRETANFYDTYFFDNKTNKYGGALASYAKTLLSGCTFSGNQSNSGGVAFVRGNTTTATNGTIFDANHALNGCGGAIWVRDAAAAFYGATFTNNTATTFGGAISVYDSAASDLYLCDTLFYNNIAINDKGKDSGGALHIGAKAKPVTISGCTFATASDSIYNLGTVNFAGNITLNASLISVSTSTSVWNIAEGTTFTLGAGVDLNGVDFSNATIKVDGAQFNKETEVVTNIGGTVTNLEVINNPFLTLVQDGTSLLLKEIAGETINSTGTVSGDGFTIMNDGSVTTFIGQKITAAQTDMIATKINGGSIDKNFIGGAFAKAENGNVSVKNTELNIGGEADVKGQVYAGGYFYGTGTESTEAQMIVSKVNIKLDGNAKVNGNLFAGIHARAAANVKVNEISISINGGEHDRIYAGGWAEGNAYSEVGESTVTLSGGTVNFVYGGGANGQGKTYVGATTITVGANAEVGTIFMSGRYGYSSTGDVELNWYGQNDMKRLSGVSSAGIDNADRTTVKLFSDLTVDGIDFVDKFVLSEGVKLTANVEFLLGNRIDGEASGATIFDFTTDGLDGAWDAIAGISDFEHALFSVNGKGQTAWTDTNAALVINGYELSYNDTEKTVTLKQLA